jgi:prepilin-type N-terminal cleavage/methylation domain-containing protein
MRDTRTRQASGFTLIELLVVIAIVGILTAILLASLSSVRAKARDTARASELHQVTSALELYYVGHGQYPPLQTLITWTGALCTSDPTCLATSDANWDDMITKLEADKDLAMTDEPKSWEETLADFILPEAYATAHKYQDPDYPTNRFAYMTSAANDNYRIRAQFSNLSGLLQSSSLDGNFYWSDKTSGADACDASIGIYCAGPRTSFAAFAPGKPVIYLYPTHTEHVAVSVDAASVDESIPAYGKGWNVIAHPSGQIDDPTDGNSYPYLYWEGKSGAPIVDRTKGFVVADADIAAFLDRALLAQGLKESEAKEFVEYWAPRMQGNPYVYVYFMPQSDYDALIPLHVTPKPDTVVRVYMLWKQLDEPIAVSPEVFHAPARTGFTVVEWGGDRRQLQ